MSKNKKRLYDVLGLDPDAPADAIKRAYRKAAKETHPDAGGNPQEFALVKLASDVLSNPERRKRYDSTGDEAEAEPDNATSRTYQVIGSSLMKIIEQTTEKNVDMATLDICYILRQMIAADLAQLAGLLDGNRAAIKKLERIERRFKKKNKDGQPNHLQIIVAGHVQMFRKGVEQGELDVAAHKRAIMILDGTSFDVVMSSGFFHGSTTLAFGG